MYYNNVFLLILAPQGELCVKEKNICYFGECPGKK